MKSSTTIGIFLLVGGACTHLTLAGAPSWLDGNAAELFLKAAAVLGLVVAAERMWRSSKR